MRSYIRVLFTVLTVAMPIAAWGQEAVEVKTTHVAGPVYMLEGNGGNIGVSAGDDGVLMIDSQFANMVEKNQAAVNALGSDLKYLLNTHFHFDHTGGNVSFGAKSTVVAHDNVLTRLKGGSFKKPEDKDGLPEETFSDAKTIEFNGDVIKLVHLPNGHTDGDCIIFFPQSNVVHMGDHFFAGRFPFVDIAGGGNPEQYTKNVQQAIDWMSPDVKIIPGHGPLSTLDDLKAFHAMLTETIEVIRKAKADGQEPKEIARSDAFKKWEGWGDGFVSTQRWISIVHASL
jgi:glyoxylase-like metal-dependent hydrolase (beta-lactamase superfamily II)